MNLKNRRKNHHQSPKAGLVYCDSSYEIKAALILDQDESVINYTNHTGFKTKTGKQRIIDFLVEYSDGRKKVIEIKPFRRMQEYAKQIKDNENYAKENSYEFEVWNEKHLGFTSESEATKWADQYLSQINKIDYVEARKQLNNEKAKRHYDNKISQDKVTVHCTFCDKEHDVLRVNYDKNIAKNGRYICMWEGGSIAGKKPGKKKVNPYAADGKKQCNECKEILPFENFGLDKMKADGYATRCKICRARKAKEKYEIQSTIATTEAK